jgi:hypothetical protein
VNCLLRKLCPVKFLFEQIGGQRNMLKRTHTRRLTNAINPMMKIILAADQNFDLRVSTVAMSALGYWYARILI